MKKTILFLLIFFTLSSSSQDLHLSQFYSNNQMLNPAMTADNDGDTQWGVNFRNQWPQINRPLQTGAISFEKRIYKGIKEYQYGVLLVHDRFEPFNMAKTSAMLSFGYPLKLGKHRITPGLQVGMTMENSDYGSRTHPSQWNYGIGEFDLGIANGEGNMAERIQYLDIAIGATHSFRFGNNNRFRWGYALNHLNKPNISSLDKDRLAYRHTAHLDLLFNLTSSIVIMPEFRYTTTVKTENLLMGGRAMYKQPGSFYNAIYAGAFYRSNLDYQDAIVPVVGIVFKTIDIGISYDINVSELSNLGEKKSTLEFSLRYQSPSSSPDKFSVPCIRY